MLLGRQPLPWLMTNCQLSVLNEKVRTVRSMSIKNKMMDNDTVLFESTWGEYGIDSDTT